LDDNETYCNLFRTKEAVKQYVKDVITESWSSPDGDEKDLKRYLKKAEKSLDEQGFFNDGQGTTFVYNEKEFTA
jgi:hypothetical protein